MSGPTTARPSWCLWFPPPSLGGEPPLATAPTFSVTCPLKAFTCRREAHEALAPGASARAATTPQRGTVSLTPHPKRNSLAARASSAAVVLLASLLCSSPSFARCPRGQAPRSHTSAARRSRQCDLSTALAAQAGAFP